MKTYTMEDWRRDGVFKASPGQQVEEGIYFQMLCDVPPIYHGGFHRTFQVGEAHSHDSELNPLYGTFTRRGDEFYFLGYLRCDNVEIENEQRKLDDAILNRSKK